MSVLNPPAETLLRTHEAAALLKISDARVRQLLADGVLHGYKPGPQLWLVPISEVEKYQQTRRTAGRPSRSLSTQ